MNELAEQNMQPSIGITEVGLSGLDGIDEETFFNIGHKLVQAEHGLQWAIGDWYNAIPWGDKQRACEEVGLNFSSASKFGFIASRYQIGTRVPNLTFTHHRTIVHDNITKGQRTELLKRATEGTPDKNGNIKVWSSKRLKEERDKLLGIAPPEPVDGFVEKVDALTEAVVSVMPKTAGRRAVNTTRNGINKLASDMQHEFTEAVDKKVEEKVRIRHENLKAAEKKAKEEFERTIRIKAGVKAFMTREEFSLVRSCLHPDKNPHPRANEAFTIFNRLADVKAWDR